MGKIKKATDKQIGYIRYMHYQLNEFKESKTEFPSLTNFRANKIIERLEKRIISGNERNKTNKKKVNKRIKIEHYQIKREACVAIHKKPKTILRKKNS